jgi:hypothetical protein
VVNVASVAGLGGDPGTGTCNTAEGALVDLNRSPVDGGLRACSGQPPHR